MANQQSPSQASTDNPILALAKSLYNWTFAIPRGMYSLSKSGHDGVDANTAAKRLIETELPAKAATTVEQYLRNVGKHPDASNPEHSNVSTESNKPGQKQSDFVEDLLLHPENYKHVMMMDKYGFPEDVIVKKDWKPHLNAKEKNAATVARDILLHPEQYTTEQRTDHDGITHNVFVLKTQAQHGNHKELAHHSNLPAEIPNFPSLGPIPVEAFQQPGASPTEATTKTTAQGTAVTTKRKLGLGPST